MDLIFCTPLKRLGFELMENVSHRCYFFSNVMKGKIIIKSHKAITNKVFYEENINLGILFLFKTI